MALARKRQALKAAGKQAGGSGLRLVTLFAFAAVVFILGLFVGTSVFHMHDASGRTLRPWEGKTQAVPVTPQPGAPVPPNLVQQPTPLPSPAMPAVPLPSPALPAAPLPTPRALPAAAPAPATYTPPAPAPLPAAPAPVAAPAPAAAAPASPFSAPAPAAGLRGTGAVAPPVNTGGEVKPEDSMRFYGDNYVQLDDPLDAHELTVGAWIYLDPDNTVEQIKTVFANRWAGCAAVSQRNGFALYVNAWNSGSRQLKVDWGNSVDGCVALASDDYTIEYGVWTHVAVAFSSSGSGKVMLFKDAQLLVQAAATRSLQTVNGMTVGMHADRQYGFVGRIGHMFALKSVATPQQLQYVYEQRTSEQLKRFAVDASARLLGLVRLYENMDGSEPGFEDMASGAVTGSVVASAQTPRPRVTAAEPAPAPAASPFADSPPAAAPAPAPAAAAAPAAAPSPAPVSGGASRWVTKFTTLPEDMVIGPVTDPVALADGGFSDAVTEAARAESDRKGRERALAVKAAMIHTWKGYEDKAWGADELKPRSGRPQNNWGGMGMTLLDSLDVLWIMGMKDEFKRARDWVADHLSFAKPRSVSFFETTIRALGGLLAAYELSKDKLFLDKAEDLGERLVMAFKTPSGVPHGQVHLTTGRSSNPGWTGSASILAEVGTVQLEFRYLAKHTGKQHFADAAENAIKVLEKHAKPNGLYPIYISPQTGAPTNRQVTFGALGDSFYEYLVKTWVQGGRRERMFRNMYDKAMDGMTNILLKRSSPNKLLFVSDWDGTRNNLKMDHLVCFVPGMLALGAHFADGTAGEANKWRDLKNAKAIAYTCYQMYAKMATGIAAEYVEFRGSNDLEAAARAPFYILRPEAIESMFIMHQITGNPIYREWGWEMFQAIDKHCKVEHGYGAYPDVRHTGRVPDDRMESFWIAETLKYHYLLQSPDHDISLERYTLNTEAHPLGVFA